MDENRIDMLKKVPLFAGLESRELRSVANTMKERNYSAGHVLAQEGQSGVGFFLIEDGEARVSAPATTSGRSR